MIEYSTAFISEYLASALNHETVRQAAIYLAAFFGNCLNFPFLLDLHIKLLFPRFLNYLPDLET